MDLHIHTPGSRDYHEPSVSYLDILRQAHLLQLDIIAFTDHNSVAGYAAMHEEIDRLAWLESLNRIQVDEQRRLDEYRRLLDQVLVLPGFEFTAMFGFHILGIFSPDTPVSLLEHLLLTLKVPAESLRQGSTTPGATADVLAAYQIIDQAGGIVIAAHANSKNGVAMRGLDFGGQTRIAYTQDVHLHALEVTDLDKRGRYTTRRFFAGSKPEYPRAMRCIQGSDAHRLMRDPANAKNLGIGERATEILLSEPSFEAVASVLKGQDLSLTRPFRGRAKPVDFVQLAREEGESIVQSFHSSAAKRGGHFNRILQDVCAMANTNGGTIYVGVSADLKQPIEGVKDPKRIKQLLQTEISKRFSPEPEFTIDEMNSQGNFVARITVESGSEPPYALDSNLFYIRDEAETTLAVRDEIVRLVERTLASDRAIASVTPAVKPQPAPATPLPSPPAASPRREAEVVPPRTGVEIVNSENRKGTVYHTVRDLRNGNLIKNVTRSSARKLWHYAISQQEAGQPDLSKVNWSQNMAVVNTRRKDDYVWYDLAMRNGDTERVFFGVTDSGMDDQWLALVENSGLLDKG